MPMARYVKLLKLPAETAIKGLRPMQKKDLGEAHELLTKYLTKFSLHFTYTVAEFEHFFLTRPGVIDSYVVQDPETKKLTDFISFYTLPSSILRHDKHKLLKVAYSFYNVPGKHTLTELMKDALVLAKNADFDVFNALDVMDNEEFLQELKFGVGDGNLHYYFYNWRIPELTPKEVATVLV